MLQTSLLNHHSATFWDTLVCPTSYSMKSTLQNGRGNHRLIAWHSYFNLFQSRIRSQAFNVNCSLTLHSVLHTPPPAKDSSISNMKLVVLALAIAATIMEVLAIPGDYTAWDYLLFISRVRVNHLANRAKELQSLSQALFRWRYQFRANIINLIWSTDNQWGASGKCKRSLDCCKSNVYCVVYTCNEEGICVNALTPEDCE